MWVYNLCMCVLCISVRFALTNLHLFTIPQKQAVAPILPSLTKPVQGGNFLAPIPPPNKRGTASENKAHDSAVNRLSAATAVANLKFESRSHQSSPVRGGHSRPGSLEMNR